MGQTSALGQVMGNAQGAAKQLPAKVKNALEAAAAKSERLQSAVKKAKENSQATADLAIQIVEVEGALFVSSVAEGYLGPEKLQVGGVDLRLGLGLAGAGYGLYQEMSGDDGSHAAALGAGVLGSFLASKGREVGERLRTEKGAKTGAAANAPAAPAAPTAPTMQGPAHRLPGGRLREVYLTPPVTPAPAEELAGPRREHRQERRQGLRPAMRMSEAQLSEAA